MFSVKLLYNHCVKLSQSVSSCNVMSLCHRREGGHLWPSLQLCPLAAHDSVWTRLSP